MLKLRIILVMSEIFYNYISYFLHPFKVNSYFREKRQDFYGPFLVDEKIPEERDFLELDIYQILIVSWLFFIVHSFYSIFFINIANFLVARFDMGDIINPRMMIFTALVQVIFFPLVFWAYAKLWVVIVEFFGNLFNADENRIEEISDQIVGVSLASHIFLLIPVIGAVIRHFAFFIYLFAGLRKNLGLSVTKSLMVILSPLFILGLLVFMFFLLLATILMGF